MQIKPHSDDEIVKVAKSMLAMKSHQGSNKVMVSVALPHTGDGVNYGYDVHFKRSKKTGEWKLDFICNTTSP